MRFRPRDRDIVKQQSSRVGLAVNSVNGSVGLLGSNYMTQIVNDLSRNWQVNCYTRHPMPK